MIEYPWGDADPSPEQLATMEEASRLVMSGLEQVRKHLGLDSTITYRRLKVLRDRIVYSQFDFDLAETYLVGTWMLASARSQDPTPVEEVVDPENPPRPGDFA